MSAQPSNNVDLTQRFTALFPGAHSNNTSAASVRTFQRRAQGARFWDVEGREYIDYTGASGPNILGHCHPRLIKAMENFMSRQSLCTGSSYLFSEHDILLGEKLVQHVPCAEQIKFCVSGTEAVQQAIRLARASTGRPYYLKFSGHYHGWVDNVYGGEVTSSGSSPPFPNFDCHPVAGQSKASQREGLMIPWANLDSLEETLRTHGDKIAIMLIETVCNSGSLLPQAGYLEKARKLCDQYGIVLCFDEVITGFRVGLTGAQGLFGVTPDLCTFGKAFGGGMPIAAVAGKRFLMEQYRDQQVMGPGTYNGHPLSVCAALTTLEILEENNGAVYASMQVRQQQLMKGLQTIAEELGVAMRVQGPCGVFATFFEVDPDAPIETVSQLPANHLALAKKFHGALWAEGVTCLFGRWFMSTVHNESDIAQTLDAFRRCLKKL